MLRKALSLVVSLLLTLCTLLPVSLVLTLCGPPVVALAAGAKRSSEPAPPAESKDDPFGYSKVFRSELARIGQITPEEFAGRYAAAPRYLRGLTWDATKATYWDSFNADSATVAARPRVHSIGEPAGAVMRLSPAELSLFRKNGFVVSERLGAPSFADLFYGIYSRDLPIFVSCDAILHAWHRSYDEMLERLEESVLAPCLDDVLAGMAAALPEAEREYGKYRNPGGAGTSGESGGSADSELGPSLRDADLFLAVARSLLRGETVPCALGKDGRLDAILSAVSEMNISEVDLFGRNRSEDFSQFKLRGHYEDSEELGRYFKAMMWCGRIDLRVAGNPEESSPRELGAALVLRDLLLRSGRLEGWRSFDRLMQTFIGPTDSMTFDQLGAILEQAQLRFPEDFSDALALEKLQAWIAASGAGRQAIRSHLYLSSPYGPDQVELPVSFAMMGQKFVPDAWALSHVVADDILWDGRKVQRRIPSSLDVAFSVLGNDQTVPLLVRRMGEPSGLRFRDGLNYQHNLAAARATIDAQSPEAWDQSLYSLWLACLRELSAPTVDPKYPESMRTEAWAGKTLNTQLASWSQLRHDTVLYAKQSATGGFTCSFPAGYVEPRPEFWRQFQKMSERAASIVAEAPLLAPLPLRTTESEKADSVLERRRKRWAEEERTREVDFFSNFARKVGTLAEIAEKELEHGELTAAEAKFLEDLIELDRGSGSPSWNGWYPSLFYKSHEDCAFQDVLVSDVHTDPPAELPDVHDPGCVLHEAIGNVDLLMIAVDCGPDRMVYAGPVLSHYEFEVEGSSRMSDSEWKKRLEGGGAHARPEWTRSYLVPAPPRNAR